MKKISDMKRLVIIILTVLLIPAASACLALRADAAGYPTLDPCGIKDAVNGSGVYVTDLKTDVNKTFSYEVPENGAAVFVSLFSGYDDRYSGFSVLQFLSEKGLTENEKVKIIAAESTGASKKTTEEFISRCLGDKTENVDLYYNTNIVWSYCSNIGVNGSITPPLVLVIGEQGGAPTILYKSFGSVSLSALQNSIASAADGIPYDEDSYVVDINVQGDELYDQLADIYNRVNGHRANNGLGPLSLSRSLTELAMQRAAECAVFYSHTRPNGETCFSVDENGIYTAGYLNAENIAAGQNSGAAVIEAWINSPGHNANILNTSSGSIGIGAFESHGVKYWVQLFGVGNDGDVEKRTENEFRTHPVEICRSTLESVSATSPSVSLNVGEDAEIPSVFIPNGAIPGWGKADLKPFAESEIKDESGAVIAETYTENGRLYIKGKAGGTAEIYLYVYENGDLKVPLTVEIKSVNTVYTVSFLNWDGAEISSVQYNAGDTVTEPDQPSKPSDQTYYYVFTGWMPEITAVSGNAEYTAVFEARAHEWNEPTYEWSADHTSVTAKRASKNDSTITQTETAAATVNTTDAGCENDGKTTYTAIFVNTAFSKQTYEETIPASGHSFKFTDFTWNGNEAYANRKCDKCEKTDTVKADVAKTEKDGVITYTAKVTLDGTTYSDEKSEYIDYTVVFKDYDGTVLSEKTYHYGDEVTIPDDPEREEDETYTYSFSGWDKEVTEVKGNETYTATYEATEKPQTQFVPGDINGDGSVNNKDVVALFKYVSGGEIAVNDIALDINGDGSVNNKDVVALFKYVSGGDIQLSDKPYDPNAKAMMFAIVPKRTGVR